MTFVQLGSTPQYQALSGDSLPTTGIQTGATVLLTDTSGRKVFDGSAWQTLASGSVTVSGNVATTAADGSNVALGALADAVVAAGAAGSIGAKLRAISRDIVANIVLATGGNVIGKVTVDQTTPGTTDSVTVATAQGAGAVIGAATSAAAVSTDATGTIHQYLRGIVKLIVAKIGVTIADGDNTTQGALADAAVTAGATGSISAKLRAISRDLVANIVLAAGTNLIGKVGLDQTTPGTTNRVQGGGTPTIISTNFSRPGDTNAYAAGDQVSNSTSAPTVLTFTSVARASGGGGLIVDATLVDESSPSTVGSFELWLFDTTFTPNNDNAALALSTTILRTLVGVIPFTTAVACGTTGQVYQADRKNIQFLTSGSANLFGCLVARNAYTPANTGRFDIRLTVAQD